MSKAIKVQNGSIIGASPIKSMTSREIAELTGKDHAHVLRDTRAVLDALKDDPELDHVKETKDARGYTSEISLPKSLTLTLTSGYSIVMRKRIIDRWLELEGDPTAATQAPKPSALVPAKEFRALFGIGRLIGLDKNAAAISANQGTVALTGTNMLALIGQTHIEAENQDALYFTPTDLGKRIKVTGQKFNAMLAGAGMQIKTGDTWEATPAGKPFARILDTGKKHNSGTPIQQIKWAANVVAAIQQGGAA